MKEQFVKHIQSGHTFKGDFITIGGAMLDGECQADAHVKVALKTMNRHGLIAGATGTGKTKTLQIIAEQLSQKGVPVLLMDLKGDLSGLAQPGALNDHITWRHGVIGNLPYEPMPMPTELLSISDEPGVKLRATISEFGPVLLAKILSLNETQEGILAIVFKYCDDNNLPLLDLKDLREVLQYCIGDGKEKIADEYGHVSATSIGAINRKIIGLEQQGAEAFFGEPSFDPDDLLRQDKNGNGYINILRLTDIQDKPGMFSTFMLSLLAEIYASFPEQGDANKPKLCIFIDEAHLVFKEASKALLDQIEAIVKLIRSKGVGLYFCTQNPNDVPDEVLGQLGLKVQHALRAFTAKDRKAIKKTAENYPISPFYETEEIITQMGIGEALVTGLNEKGIPTPLAATLLRAPQTRMDILTKSEISDVVKHSELVAEYNKSVDRKSAYEILNEKISVAQEDEHQKELEEHNNKGYREVVRPEEEEDGFMEKAKAFTKNPLVRQIARTVSRELTRGLLGALGVSTKSRTRRRRRR